MELTVEQILQQGVTAHKEGKLQEAVRLYSTIIQTQPTHQDANYNLGLIAVSSNNIKPAVLLFKTALEANPKIKQFWLSYIEILVKDNQVATAKAVLTIKFFLSFIAALISFAFSVIARNPILIPSILTFLIVVKKN